MNSKILLVLCVFGLLYFSLQIENLRIPNHDKCDDVVSRISENENRKYLLDYSENLLKKRNLWRDVSIASETMTGLISNHPTIKRFDFGWSRFVGDVSGLSFELVGKQSRIRYRSFDIKDVAQLRIGFNRKVIVISFSSEGEMNQNRIELDRGARPYIKIDENISLVCWDG